MHKIIEIKRIYFLLNQTKGNIKYKCKKLSKICCHICNDKEKGKHYIMLYTIIITLAPFENSIYKNIYIRIDYKLSHHHISIWCGLINVLYKVPIII